MAIVFLSVILSFDLSVFPGLWPVSKEWDIKKHVPSKNRYTWWGFKHCVIGRANGPCCIGDQWGILENLVADKRSKKWFPDDEKLILWAIEMVEIEDYRTLVLSFLS